MSYPCLWKQRPEPSASVMPDDQSLQGRPKVDSTTGTVKVGRGAVQGGVGREGRRSRGGAAPDSTPSRPWWWGCLAGRGS